MVSATHRHSGHRRGRLDRSGQHDRAIDDRGLVRRWRSLVRYQELLDLRRAHRCRRQAGVDGWHPGSGRPPIRTGIPAGAHCGRSLDLDVECPAAGGQPRCAPCIQVDPRSGRSCLEIPSAKRGARNIIASAGRRRCPVALPAQANSIQRSDRNRSRKRRLRRQGGHRAGAQQRCPPPGVPGNSVVVRQTNQSAPFAPSRGDATRPIVGWTTMGTRTWLTKQANSLTRFG
jgi:hypothetical protein